MIISMKTHLFYTKGSQKPNFVSKVLKLLFQSIYENFIYMFSLVIFGFNFVLCLKIRVKYIYL